MRVIWAGAAIALVYAAWVGFALGDHRAGLVSVFLLICLGSPRGWRGPLLASSTGLLLLWFAWIAFQEEQSAELIASFVVGAISVWLLPIWIQVRRQSTVPKIS